MLQHNDGCAVENKIVNTLQLLNTQKYVRQYMKAK